MSIESEKLDCEFHLRDGSQHQATAHLFQHKYAGRVFWYGVAQLGDKPTDLPDETLAGKVIFENELSGGVSLVDGSLNTSGYYEVGFIGVTTLG